MKDEALRLALEALKGNRAWLETDAPTEVWEKNNEAITASKAALLSRSDGEAKDEPEYYGLTKDHLWMSISKEHYDRLKPEFRMACYTTPPQRTWVGLSDEDRFELAKAQHGWEDLLIAAEAKLKEKNT